jgi:hypothetical protein
MKKKEVLSILISLGVIFMFAAASLASDNAGQVLAVKKDVYRIRGNTQDTAKPKMGLAMKDAVATDKDSRTKLFFNDDSILNLGELSKVEVGEYLYSPDKQRSKSVYRLIDGSVKVIVGRSDLEVHTASAVAAARGTKFIMFKESAIKAADKKSKSDKTCVMTLEGKVEFRLKKEAITDKTKRDKIMVNEGMMSCIEVNDLSDVTEISSRAMRQKAEEFPVMASDIPAQGSLPAFAPEPPIIDPPDIPIIQDQEPIPPGPQPEPEVNIQLLWPERSRGEVN